MESIMTRQIPQLFREYGTVRRYFAGQQLFLKGMDAEEIYFLERGKVRAYILYPDGTERTLCFVERGNLVGEEAVGIPPIRIVCADAAEDLLMYGMHAQTLLQIAGQVPACLPELLPLFMKKIEVLSNWIFYAQFTQNNAKLACFLYSNADGGGRVRYTQEQIAAVTGMSRPSVSKGLKLLESRGLLRRGYRVIQVERRGELLEYFDHRNF